MFFVLVPVLVLSFLPVFIKLVVCSLSWFCGGFKTMLGYGRFAMFFLVHVMLLVMGWFLFYVLFGEFGGSFFACVHFMFCMLHGICVS